MSFSFKEWAEFFGAISALIYNVYGWYVFFIKIPALTKRIERLENEASY